MSLQKKDRSIPSTTRTGVLWQGEDVCTHLHRWGLAVVVALALTCTAGARAGDLQITHAWILPVDKVGVDVPLLLTVVNNGAEEDALMRVRCPVANFSEKYTVDRGEGAPSGARSGRFRLLLARRGVS